MAGSIKSVCNFPGCNSLTDYDHRMCKAHKEQANKKHNYPDELKSFYSSRAWQRLRKQHVQVEPLCIKCLEDGTPKAAQVVDHIVPIRIDFNKRLEPGNLQSLCHKHHNKKTNDDKIKYSGMLGAGQIHSAADTDDHYAKYFD